MLRQYLRPGTLARMDKGYDSDAIRTYVNQLAVIAVNASRAQKHMHVFAAMLTLPAASSGLNLSPPLFADTA